jgi:hypothetical protein
MRDRRRRGCAACGAARAKLKCDGCDGKVYYCDSACQRDAWPRHRTACLGKLHTSQQVVDVLAAAAADPAAVWVPGTQVMLHGLVRRPELNGHAFIVTGFDEERGRVTGHMGSSDDGLCIRSGNIAAVTYRHEGTQGEARYVMGDITTEEGREEVRTVLSAQNVACPTPITACIPKSDFLLAPMPLVGDPSPFPGDGVAFLEQLRNNQGTEQRYVDLTHSTLSCAPVPSNYNAHMELHTLVGHAIKLATSSTPTVVLLRCTESNAAAFREMLRVQILMAQTMMCGWKCVHALHIEPYCGVLFYGADVHYILPQPSLQRLVDVATQYMSGLPCVFCGEALSNQMEQTGTPNVQLPCDGGMCQAHTVCAVASAVQTCPNHGTSMGLMYAPTPRRNIIAVSAEDAAHMEGFSWHTAAEMRDGCAVE